MFSTNDLTQLKPNTARSFWPYILRGGYPEMILRKQSQRQHAWFKAYLDSILMRDIKDLSQIEGLTQLPNLFHLLAIRAGNLLNFAELSRSAQLPQTTLKRYVSLLEMTFLVSFLKPWANNLTKRLVKSPKIMLNDSGLLAYLLGIKLSNLDQNQIKLGHLLENFVYNEIIKQNTSGDYCFCCHLRAG